MSELTENPQRCGNVAIVGRPNVGKSTLLNQLVGQKLSITARKPQTTRHAIVGVSTVDHRQAIYVDTPGIHLQGRRALNQVLNRTAANSLHDVDVIVWVIQAMAWNEHDDRARSMIEAASSANVPLFVFVNKVDRVEPRSKLLPFLDSLPVPAASSEVSSAMTDSGNNPPVFSRVEIIPGSALKKTAVEVLESQIFDALPVAPFRFAEDDLTDRSSRFLAAEHVREQLTRQLSDELPYALTVEIEQFNESSDLVRIGAVIWVEKDSQKGIVIGKNGERLKTVGTRARQSLQTLFDCKVFLQLWVRVKAGWADDERALQSLGYTDHSEGHAADTGNRSR